MSFAHLGAALLLASATSTGFTAEEDWPSYNKTLTSNRHSALREINTFNVTGLKVTCRFDTGVRAAGP
jgi:alcohol dehydrogenase (cytochrome c)